MKIGIIGATGMSGQKIYHEAQARRHEVTAIVRNREKAQQLLGADAHLLVKDAFNLTFSDLADFDVIVEAFSVPIGKHLGYLHLDIAAHLVHLLRNQATPRIIFILGAASLLNDQNTPFLESIKKAPGAEAWIDTPATQAYELELLRTATNVNWTGISPSLNYVDGPKTEYVRGENHALFNNAGKSEVNSGTLATALLDEIEQPQAKQTRFTVRNAD
ncbi:NAD(P)H-binding protein [Paucilactobacillus wasatchensis]|uniref:Putative NADH-flavin reductase n=1 Tax=Paucilactobacillus wasatchensis TaxID=1335616 RepID=A0A0D1AC71_9LACO|nr:NAD(P)H-binding protein [Paucilactobacillus wasatchensis]KIS04266.1 putative NADH-flavin reductase [Paucilactobacillus wasatchensis]